MKIFPECQHLKMTMFVTSLVGIWPFIFENQPILKKIYHTYANCMLIYYSIFICTAYIKLGQILTTETVVLSELSSNLCVTLIYTITIVRQIILKQEGVKKIIRHIILKEKQMYDMYDQELIKIYEKCTQQMINVSKIYIRIMFIITMNYFIHPLFSDPNVVGHGNETILMKKLPLSSWMPFDTNKHYAVAYVWHILDGSVGSLFVAYTDVLMFSIIVYPSGQLKILQHVLRNFQKYKKQNMIKFGIGNENEAAIKTFMQCYFKHMEIINYVSEFNKAMKNLMVFDFLQSSIQIATILTQLIGLKLTLIAIIYVGCFFIGMVLRLLFYYYSANEIMLLSEGLSYAAWESDWHIENSEFKFMIRMLMLRCKTGLKLNIGSFGVMSLSSFIAILKATYSYLMLMYGSS